LWAFVVVAGVAVWVWEVELAGVDAAVLELVDDDAELPPQAANPMAIAIALSIVRFIKRTPIVAGKTWSPGYKTPPSPFCFALPTRGHNNASPGSAAQAG
jgi:hypothetical protein